MNIRLDVLGLKTFALYQLYITEVMSLVMFSVFMFDFFLFVSNFLRQVPKNTLCV